jgi:hypothetical protein
MAGNPHYQASEGGPMTENTPTIHVVKNGGHLSITAHLNIAGKRAELILPAWLDAAGESTPLAVRTALRRAALSFLEGLE